MAGNSDYRDIFLVEAVGPLLILIAFPKVMRGALGIRLVDNATADSSLVSGSSSIDAGDHVAGMTWEMISQRRLWPYFDGVRSKSNPVDGL